MDCALQVQLMLLQSLLVAYIMYCNDWGYYLKLIE